MAYVLDAATRILDEEGLAGLNTNAVARRAGVSVGSLYQYFPGKEAITAALILRSHEEIIIGMRDLLERTANLPADAAIDALLDMLLRLQTGSKRVNQILEMEEERLPRTAELLALESEIARLNLSFFGRYIDQTRCSDQELNIAANDTIHILRALLDAAAKSGTLDDPSLHDRLRRTVAGYLAPLLPGLGP